MTLRSIICVVIICMIWAGSIIAEGPEPINVENLSDSTEQHYQTVELKGPLGELWAVVKVDTTTKQVTYYLDFDKEGNDVWITPKPEDQKALQTLFEDTPLFAENSGL